MPHQAGPERMMRGLMILGAMLLAPGSLGAQEIGRSAARAVYDAEELRDPMKNLLPEAPPTPVDGPGQLTQIPPEPPPEPEPPTATLEGLIWGGAFPQAIMNGTVYGVGDTVEGAEIVAITRNGVVVRTQDAVFLISPSSGSSSKVKQIANQQ